MERLYSLSLTAADLNTIYLALGELPLKTSLGVFSSLQQQILTQESTAALQPATASSIVS